MTHLSHSLRKAGTNVSVPGAFAVLLFLGGQNTLAQSVFINELHYDNSGTDVGEAIEIAGPAGSDVGGCSIVLYNGANGSSYNTRNLSGTIPDQGGGFGTLVFSYPTNGIQNGAPDGIALVAGSTVLQFLSYEGDFQAVGGPADGLTSTDIGVSESGSTAVGESLQLTGAGSTAADFSWQAPQANSFGAINAGQTFMVGGPGETNPCEPPGAETLEIFEIQGAGDASPFAGAEVETNDNVVTALGTDGFFMQTPDFRTDGNVDTSDGIFVFTDSAPPVAVGDLVDVVGRVTERFGTTQISSVSSITVNSSGNSLPPPVIFDTAVPSPDPTAPSCAIEFECYEGMLVQITNGTVGGPNQRFSSDTVAEVFIRAADTRPFREPGVEFPGLGMPPIETWDGNPEVFELDPDKLGLPNRIIPAGSSFDAVGVIGFEFGGYELWPTELTVREASIPRGIRPRQRAEFTIGSLNLFRLFDDIDDPVDTTSQGRERDDVVVSTDEYERRRAKFVAYILSVLDAPDVLAVQEVEKLGVLEDLAADIAVADPGAVYTAYLEEGNDVGTIDVGFLVRDSVAVDAVSQFGKDEILAFDGSLLHDRPPLILEGRSVDDGADYPFAVMVVHNRSLGGISSPTSGERVRAKRLAQAQSIAAKIQALQTEDPGIRLVVTGDFNASEFSDGFIDAVGQIAGNFDPAANLLSGPDLVEPNLSNQVLSLDQGERYSFVFRGNAQVLDHALTSTALGESTRGLEYGRGNADAAVDLINDDSTELRSSDHDGLVLFLTKDVDDDGVNDDADICPATVIPETLTRGLRPFRYALIDDNFVFDTVTRGGRPPLLSFDTEDTGGCSCEQIGDIFGLGRTHEKFGCGIGVMFVWSVIVELRDRLHQLE